jgi:high-affinity Fe2+/Pb2+ permease
MKLSDQSRWNAIRKAIAGALMGMVLPVFIAIFFTPNESGKLITAGIGVVLVAASLVLFLLWR